MTTRPGKSLSMTDPLVSIITRTRERPGFLARAAKSVMNQQTPPSFEWIVVNDGGPREPVDQVLEGLPEGKHVRVRHLPASRGMEHASNTGIGLAGGRYLAIHDDDDSWEPEFLREMTTFLEEPGNRAFGGVVCHSTRVVERIEKDALIEESRHPFNPWLTEVEFFRVLQENPFPPISFLFRRSLYQRTGPFREDLPVLGDWEFNLRALARSRLAVLPRLLAFYHHRPPRTSGPEANSITAGDRRHRETEAALRAEWAERNPFGIDPDIFGKAAAGAGHLHCLRVVLNRMEAMAETLPKPVPPQY